ncbi:MAG: carbohydrate ABC transporter permease [Lachnospiraceae bacterium]|nr:carbohydrate ABC transporter permease [Lachnospiraceae bacterium]MCI9324917.1 carbohydrate ABC transporter permease [Lachnospiraceae bacterium]
MKKSKSRKLFEACNYIMITLITLSCLIPILNLLANSFSSSQAIIENRVSIFPVEFTLKAYQYVINNQEFWSSVAVSAKRVLLGVPLNVILTILVAYPLSKSELVFPARKYYVAFMLVVMLFNGGLMPTYFIVSKTGLIDTIWSLLLPGAVPVFSCIVLMNFFRGIPEELEESARLDGANQFQIMIKIFLPLSKPSIATVTLFSLVWHWNAWFDGLIYSNYTSNYPLQSYLQTLVVSTTDALKTGDLKTIMELTQVNDTNMKAAQIFISIIPLMLVYPFLQKYFTTGLTLGSVKG